MITAKKLKRRKFRLKLKARAGRMIKKPTPSELFVRDKLKELKIEFHHQRILKPYIVDFFLPLTKTIIEIDGGYHNNPHVIEYDKRREECLRKRGNSFIRIRNEDVGKFDFESLIIANSRNAKQLRKAQRKQDSKELYAKMAEEMRLAFKDIHADAEAPF